MPKCLINKTYVNREYLKSQITVYQLSTGSESTFF